MLAQGISAISPHPTYFMLPFLKASTKAKILEAKGKKFLNFFIILVFCLHRSRIKGGMSLGSGLKSQSRAHSKSFLKPTSRAYITES